MDEKIKVLKEKLQYIGTRDLLGMIGIHFITFANGASDMAEQSNIFNKTDLISPQKQYTYLAGLLMSTDDKSDGHITNDEESGIYNELENDVQEITLEYTKTFLDIDPSSKSDDIKRNLVSMDAFTSYFDTGILRYAEQTIHLIKILYSSFDSELESLTGLITEDYIAFYQLVCDEFERGTKEHDILIEFHDYILIAEVKASKVRVPFFNPQKAYKRISDHFHSDSGIGGAYSQAITLKKFIEGQKDIVLYENKNNKFYLENISQKIILPLILTLNQFGGLAVNTSLILEKDADEPYPWVCNWHDFENIIEILEYLHKGPQDFIDYVVWRIDNHANVLSSDELDVIEGYFLDSQLREKIKSSAAFFPPNGPSLIDKIYFEKHGIPYEYPGIKNADVRKKKKIGRNEPCPCGSGKKFKRCCLGKGIYD